MNGSRREFAGRLLLEWGGIRRLCGLALLSVGWALSLFRRRRVPVVLQLSNVECAAACLAMILGFFGQKHVVSECRNVLGAGRDGVNALSLTQAARAFGLQVKAFMLTPADCQRLPLPAIIHWNFNHFVALERCGSRWMDIVDPASGRRRVSQEEFAGSFTGVALAFEAGAEFQRRRQGSSLTWAQYLKGFLTAPGVRGVMLQTLGASLLLQAVGLALPGLTKTLVDQVIPMQATSVMAILGIGMAVILAAQLVTSYLRAALLMYLQARLDTYMMLGFFEHILSLPLRFFRIRSSGDLLARLSSNTVVRETLTSQTLSTVLDGSLIVVYLALLMALEPSFGAIVLALAVLEIALLAFTNRRMRELMQRDLAAEAESHSYIVEALTGIGTLKAAGIEERAFTRWSSLFFKRLTVSLQRNNLNALIETAMVALRGGSPMLLLWVGAAYVLRGDMTLGTMLALTSMGTFTLAPLASLMSAGQSLQLVGAHLDRITDVAMAQPEQDSQAARPAPKLSGKIEVRDMSFSYDPNSPLALRNISVSIEPGQKVAIVGRTGSGKSTLASLLLGFYTPNQGEVFFDGAPLHSLNYRSLRNQFGVVLQESALFSGSIRSNITFDDPTVSEERIIEAAKLAAIHDDIMRMPMGYETIISEGGSGLSGGQRQRLALARALAHAPAILLLDEATSHLDAVTESQVDQNLSNLACTRVVIAHRLSTIRNADLILVLENGAIVERGSHAELLTKGGHYAQLVAAQSEQATAGGMAKAANVLMPTED